MPYVNIRVAGKLTKEQKEKICAEITSTISAVTGKPKSTVLIFVDELEHENISLGGTLLQKPL